MLLSTSLFDLRVTVASELLDALTTDADSIAARL